MRFLLVVLAILAFMVGFAILVSGKSAIHEIEGFVLYVVAAVLFVGAAIVDAILNLPKRLLAAQRAATENK